MARVVYLEYELYFFIEGRGLMTIFSEQSRGFELYRTSFTNLVCIHVTFTNSQIKMQVTMNAILRRTTRMTHFMLPD